MKVEKYLNIFERSTQGRLRIQQKCESSEVTLDEAKELINPKLFVLVRSTHRSFFFVLDRTAEKELLDTHISNEGFTSGFLVSGDPEDLLDLLHSHLTIRNADKFII